MIIDDHVAGQGRLAAHHQVVADDAVVGDMTVGQDHVVVAEHRAIAVLGGEMHRHVFPKNVAVADAQAGIAALKLQVVRLGADGGVGKHLALPAQHRVALDGGVVVNDRAVADDGRATDKSVGTDRHLGPHLDLRLNNSGGMDLGSHGQGERPAAGPKPPTAAIVLR